MNSTMKLKCCRSRSTRYRFSWISFASSVSFLRSLLRIWWFCLWFFVWLRSSLSINALRACVYIYIRQLSSFRAYIGLSIWLSLLAIFNTLFWFYAKIARENRQNTEILEVRHFRMLRKWSPTVVRRVKHWYWELLVVLLVLIVRERLNTETEKR